VPRKDPELAPPAEPDEGVASARRRVDDLSVRELRLKTPGRLRGPERAPAYLCWSGDGQSFYHLEPETGVLRRIALKGFQEQARLEVKAPCRWLSRSGQGLLVTLAAKPQVWVVDPETLQLRDQIESGFAARVVSAPALNVAFAGIKAPGWGDSCSVLDLKARTVVRQYSRRDVPRSAGLVCPVITPDGKYLFAQGDNAMHRYRIDGAALVFEESSQRLCQGGESICISPDSQFVCLPTGGGQRGLKGHPEVKPYSTFVYPVTSINKPAYFLESGAYPRAVGFDTKAGLVYGQNHRYQLILFSPTGIKLKEYAFPGTRDVTEIVVHPEGRKLLLLTDNTILYIELPKQ
jgi:hypothetical protein